MASTVTEQKTSFNFTLPEIYQIEVTNACNFKCPKCFREMMHRDVGFIEKSLVETIAERDLGNSYFVELQFAGEPLLHPELGEIIDILKRKKVLVGLSTNGLLIDKNIDSLKKLDYLTISVDSLYKSVYNKIRVGGDLKKLLSNIDLLFKEKVQTKIDLQVVNFMENTSNALANLRRYVETKNWDCIVREVPDCQVSFRDKDLKKVFKKLCLNPWLSVSVQWDGDVVPCCFAFDKQIVYGNLNKNSLYEIWNDPAVACMRERQKTSMLYSLCSKCYMKSPAMLHLKMLMNWLNKKTEKEGN